ncbi:MAG: EAL domain-containing protein [Lachnospiraceae bacterium]|nr:EAL domain-containing protein [Lachnospiraceae bacterium]
MNINQVNGVKKLSTESTNQAEQLSLLATKAECGLIKLAYNSEMTILYANEYFYTLHGYTQEEYTEQFGSNALARIHPDDAQRFKASVARQLNMGTALRFEYRIIKKDGSIRWLLIKGQMTANNQRIAYLCSCIDITSMKVSYQDLAKSKQDLDVISNNIPGGVFKVRLSDYKILYANNTFFEITGYSRLEYEELFGNICIGLVVPEDVPKLQEQIKTAVREHSTLSTEYRIIHKSGQIRWSHINGSLIDSDDDEQVFLCVEVDYTMQKEYEKHLELFQKKSQILAELTNERLWEYDIHADIMRRSGKLDTSFSNEDEVRNFLTYVKDRNIIHVDDQNTFFKAIQFSRTSKKDLKVEIRMLNNIGIYTWYRLQGVVMFDDNGKPYQIIGKTIDIDSSKQQFLKLQEEAQRDNLTKLNNITALADHVNGILPQLSENQEAALMLIDLDRFKILTDRYGQLVSEEILTQTARIIQEVFPGYSTGRVDADQFVVFLPEIKTTHDLQKTTELICDLIQKIEFKDNPDMKVTCSIGYFTTKDPTFTFEIMLLRANVALRSMKSKGGNGSEAYGSFKNNTTISSEAARTTSHEDYDQLTGLLSLPAFISEGEKLLNNGLDARHFAVIYFDINSFKIFNANYGFTIGNKILRYFSRVLEEEKQENELCCHVANDEFITLVNFERAQDLAMRFSVLKNHFSGTNMSVEDYFRFNFTCGVYLAKKGETDIAQMIDKANYARKSTKNVSELSHYALYDANMEISAKKHLLIEANIDQAMKKGEIIPYLQPRYSLHTEQLIGMEVLARWNKPDGSALIPEEFFPVLEENGFIVELDFYMIEQTLRIIKQWMAKDLPILPVSFNISGCHLRTSNFVERLLELMTQYSIPINYLELEISEKVFVQSPDTTSFLVQELSDLGFKIVLDDFGKEYSAINSLKDLPIQGVKLDTAFFSGKIQKEKERIIFKKIIEMVKELHLSVASESVETTLQAEQLKEFGCDIAQGFLYHNPMPIDEFEEYILSRIH